jgi:hypothetical protein
MLAFLTILIMAGIGYASLAEGFFTAFLMFCNVFLAGIITFNFWEPVAGQLEGVFAGSFLAGYEDALTMVVMFCVTLGILRTLTNNLASSEIEFDETLQRAGGAFFGLITGYLVAGFLACALQTLPWHENFMGFEAHYAANQSGLRRVLPPDRVWLAAMHRAGEQAFATDDGQETFDPLGTYELRYARFRRYNDTRNALPYCGEFGRGKGP